MSYRLAPTLLEICKFLGIIESLGKVTNVKVDRGNIDFTIESEISKELKIDQSVSHNGVCLTVAS